MSDLDVSSQSKTFTNNTDQAQFVTVGGKTFTIAAHSTDTMSVAQTAGSKSGIFTVTLFDSSGKPITQTTAISTNAAFPTISPPSDHTPAPAGTYSGNPWLAPNFMVALTALMRAIANLETQNEYQDAMSELSTRKTMVSAQIEMADYQYQSDVYQAMTEFVGAIQSVLTALSDGGTLVGMARNSNKAKKDMDDYVKEGNQERENAYATAAAGKEDATESLFGKNNKATGVSVEEVGLEDEARGATERTAGRTGEAGGEGPSFTIEPEIAEADQHNARVANARDNANPANSDNAEFEVEGREPAQARPRANDDEAGAGGGDQGDSEHEGFPSFGEMDTFTNIHESDSQIAASTKTKIQNKVKYDKLLADEKENYEEERALTGSEPNAEETLRDIKSRRKDLNTEMDKLRKDGIKLNDKEKAFVKKVQDYADDNQIDAYLKDHPDDAVLVDKVRNKIRNEEPLAPEESALVARIKSTAPYKRDPGIQKYLKDNPQEQKLVESLERKLSNRSKYAELKSQHEAAEGDPKKQLEIQKKMDKIPEEERTPTQEEYRAARRVQGHSKDIKGKVDKLKEQYAKDPSSAPKEIQEAEGAYKNRKEYATRLYTEKLQQYNMYTNAQVDLMKQVIAAAGGSVKAFILMEKANADFERGVLQAYLTALQKLNESSASYRQNDRSNLDRFLQFFSEALHSYTRSMTPA